MRIIDLLQKNKPHKPIELIYCLQSYTESALVDKISVWKKIDVLDVQMGDHTQLVRALQHQLYGELFDLFQIQSQSNYPLQSYYPMIMLGHWNDGQSL
jgi:hypothetical protein